MTAFAERAEQRKWLPGGSYQVGAQGNREDFVLSLAQFVEALIETPIQKEVRTNFVVVLLL